MSAQSLFWWKWLTLKTEGEKEKEKEKRLQGLAVVGLRELIECGSSWLCAAGACVFGRS